MKKGTRTGKLRICSYHQTIKDKIKGLIETRKIDESLIKHYIFILEHFDDIIAEHDKEIAKIDEAKAEILKQFIEAPEQLIQLNKHLAEMVKKIVDTKDAATGKKQKVKRLKSLRERLAVMQQEFEADGIDIDQEIENLNKYNEAMSTKLKGE